MATATVATHDVYAGESTIAKRVILRLRVNEFKSEGRSRE